MNVFSAADADKIRRFEQVQTAADFMSAHSYFSLKQIRRNLSRPSQDLKHVTEVVLVLRRNNNLTRTTSESGSNRRQKSIFTASNRQSAIPV